eukprot:7371611-Ditylum_brightwellii.AAC.1
MAQLKAASMLKALGIGDRVGSNDGYDEDEGCSDGTIDTDGAWDRVGDEDGTEDIVGACVHGKGPSCSSLLQKPSHGSSYNSSGNF